jgi:hypothetical protein
LVLDACSLDHTVQFARGAGAQVVQREWTDFVDARRFALAQVETPWALMIDADEALDDVLRDAIVNAAGDVDAYKLRRTTYFSGRPMRIWRREPLVRLFRRDRATLNANPAAAQDALLHEAWVAPGPVAELAGTLLHFSYPDVSTYRMKFDRYTTLEAAHIHGSASALAGAWCEGLLRFLWLLLARGALLDGPRGWYVAYRSGMYRAVAVRKAMMR